MMDILTMLQIARITMMHSPKILLNGLIQMVMDSAIIQKEIMQMHSLKILLNGLIQMVMDSVMKRTETTQIIVHLKKEIVLRTD